MDRAKNILVAIGIVCGILVLSAGYMPLPLGIINGGTGATSASAARTALGLATQVCTLNAGAPSTCTITVASGCTPICTPQGASATGIGIVAAVSGTTLTVTGLAALSNVIGCICF